TVLVGGNGPGTTITLTGSFTGLAPGASFTVSESVPSSFTAVGSVMCTTSFTPGGSATCAFTDQAKGQILETKRADVGTRVTIFSLTPTVATSGSTVL